MFNNLRRLYDWVLHWSETPYGIPALFILAFAESTFFPLPPDVLLIALVLGMRKKALQFAFICTLGSVIGGLAGYGIGQYFWWNGSNYSAVANFFFTHIPGVTESIFVQIQEQYSTYGFLIIFTAGFTPIPYKIITISSGAFNIAMPLFLTASIISRSARFFMVAVLIWKYGEPIKIFIDRYFNILTVIFVILLAGGILFVKFI